MPFNLRYAIVVLLFLVSTAVAEPWKRHTIDDSSRGADGVRLADVNGDGLMDITTGWEEGGVIRVYLHPGQKRAKEKWPAVTVGKVKSPEDAVFADLDGDGNFDVVSSCEGRTRTIYVHWAPRDKAKYLDSKSWKTETIPATEKKQSWMFALPMQVDGRGGIDLIVGSKGKGATVGWLQSPKDPRDLAAWKFHLLYKAGWIMSLRPHDVDGDGDSDVVISDRKGKNNGVLWLENPGAKAAAAGAKWNEHRIGAAGHEVMFLDIVDLDGDGMTDVLCSARRGKIVYMRRTSNKPIRWETHLIGNPDGIQHGKSVRVGDIDGDGRLDIAHDSNTYGKRDVPAVSWLSYRKRVIDADWQTHDISGKVGVKFDLIELLDMDGDGDLDLLTCEERDNLGVFWYENPLR